MNTTRTINKAKCVIITIHGIRKGDTLKKLRKKLSDDIDFKDCVIETLNYGYVYALVNYLPIFRELTRRYITSFLSCVSYKYPYAVIKVVSHSNGTFGIGGAIEASLIKFRLDKLLLFGCVLKRKFDWGRFPGIKVINFKSKNDMVVLLAKPFYGMGWAGRYGFKKKAANLMEIEINRGHTGFLEDYNIIKDVLKG